MSADLLNPHAIEELAEPTVLFTQTALQSPDVHAKGMRNLTDGGAPGRHQQSDGLFDLLDDAALARIDDGIDQLSCMARKGAFGPRKRPIQICPFNDDAVEIVAEL